MRAAFRTGAIAAVAAAALIMTGCSADSGSEGVGRRPDRAHLLGLGAQPRQGGRHLERRAPRASRSPSTSRTAATPRSPSCSPPSRPAAARPTWSRPSTRRSRRSSPPTRSPTSPARAQRTLRASSPTACGTRSRSAPTRVYAIPQDTGPMMFYYRDDLFTQLGLTVPTTWDEYAATARALHTADPSKFLGTFSANDAGWFAGLAQQARRRVVVDRRRRLERRHRRGSPPSRSPTTGAAWSRRASSTTSRCTPPSGTRRSTTARRSAGSAPSGRPGVLSGNAADTAGQVEGRAAAAVGRRRSPPATGAARPPRSPSQSKHVDAAAEFATWLNTDPEAVQALVTETRHLPGLDGGRGIRPHRGAGVLQPTSPTSTTSPPRPRRPSRRSTFGPNVNVAYSAYNDAFAKAAEAKSRQAFLDAVDRDAADHGRRPRDERLHRRRVGLAGRVAPKARIETTPGSTRSRYSTGTAGRTRHDRHGRSPARRRRPPAAPRHPPSRSAGRRHLTPWMILAPGIVLFTLFMAAPILYTFVLSLPEGEGEGPRARHGRPDAHVRRPRELRRDAHRPRVPRQRRPGARLRAHPRADHARPGAAVRAAARRPPHRARRASRGSRSSCRTRCRASSRRCSGASSTCRPSARSTGSSSSSAGTTCPRCSRPASSSSRSRTSALWGGVGFNMIVMYTSLQAVPTEIYEAARIDGGIRAADRAAHQDPDHHARAHHDRAVLDDRDPAGVRRADDAAAAHQQPLHDLDAAHEGLPRRVHARRHLLGRRDLGRSSRSPRSRSPSSSSASCSGAPSARRTEP